MENKKLLQLCDELGVLKQLTHRGYIEREGEEVIFTEKANKLVENNKTTLTAASKGVEEWIDDYRELFPKSVTSGGYPVRGDRKACIKKMQQFIKENPEYSNKELILNATRSYINRKELENFRYMKLAHYFIMKDKVSSLASECEMILESEINSDKNSSFEEGM